MNESLSCQVAAAPPPPASINPSRFACLPPLQPWPSLPVCRIKSGRRPPSVNGNAALGIAKRPPLSAYSPLSQPAC